MEYQQQYQIVLNNIPPGWQIPSWGFTKSKTLSAVPLNRARQGKDYVRTVKWRRNDSTKVSQQHDVTQLDHSTTLQRYIQFCRRRGDKIKFKQSRTPPAHLDLDTYMSSITAAFITWLQIAEVTGERTGPQLRGESSTQEGSGPWRCALINRHLNALKQT